MTDGFQPPKYNLPEYMALEARLAAEEAHDQMARLWRVHLARAYYALEEPLFPEEGICERVISVVRQYTQHHARETLIYAGMAASKSFGDSLRDPNTTLMDLKEIKDFGKLLLGVEQRMPRDSFTEADSADDIRLAGIVLYRIPIGAWYLRISEGQQPRQRISTTPDHEQVRHLRQLAEERYVVPSLAGILRKAVKSIEQGPL